ncbi:hypothetical protein TgHK011_004798 [Trichoderma gracile]|nr:hypothetical protein TgHK011_004798 [Trichoderma gracile]
MTHGARAFRVAAIQCQSRVHYGSSFSLDLTSFGCLLRLEPMSWDSIAEPDLTPKPTNLCEFAPFCTQQLMSNWNYASLVVICSEVSISGGLPDRHRHEAISFSIPLHTSL